MQKNSNNTSNDDAREEEVSKLAEEIRGVVVGGLLEKLRDIDVKAGEFEEFFRGLLGESDTVLAIVGWSYIDDRLRDLFCQAMNPDITRGSESLFEALGPLASSSSRIQMAAALYWLNKPTYLNLHLIRKIRNEFAHKPFCRTFEEKRISSLVTSMAAPEDAALNRLSGQRPVTGRQRFFLRTMMTCQRMIAEMVSAPHAIRSGLSPFSALSVGWDSLPEGIKDLIRATAKLCFECLGDDSARDGVPGAVK